MGLSVAWVSESGGGDVSREGVSGQDGAGVKAGRIASGRAGEGSGRMGSLRVHVGCWLCSWVCSGIVEQSCWWSDCLVRALANVAGVLVPFVHWIG